MEIRTPEQLGQAIRARRKALGATQSDVALTAGTGLRFIVDLENGKPTCQLGKTLDVLQSLGLSITLTPRSAAGTGEER